MTHPRPVSMFLTTLLLLTVGCRATPSPTAAPISTLSPVKTTTSAQEPDLTEAGVQARQLAEAGVAHNADWTPYIEVVNGVEMALVPAGCFMMGTTDQQLDDVFEFCKGQPETGMCDRTEFKAEQPMHQVCFNEPFWIDVTEVTNDQFKVFGGQASTLSHWTDADRPRETITWAEADAFCQQRGARLLTEAEWEYTARGPDSLVYPWGDQFIADNVVYSENSDRQTRPVGSKPGGVSWVGALDLSGNVWEWVSDWYGEYPSGKQVNPGGASDGELRVLRGGSWDRAVGRIRAANRGWADPDIGRYSYGFRCGKTIDESTTPSSTSKPSSGEDAGALALAEEGVTNNTGWTPHTEDINGVLMALVPVGCFMMGSNDGDSDEQPVHRVCFDEPFWIDVYEVTNKASGSVGCQSSSSKPDQPRNCINWADSLAHCESRGARLPTEAEWEYAARGPDSLTYPWGDEFVADNVVYDGNSGGHTWTVGSKPGGVSWIGAYDLSGNVCEAVNDWYDAGYYGTLADAVINPQGPGSGDKRVVRGGSWDFSIAASLRAAFRNWYHPSSEFYGYGFRCARSWQP